MKSRLFQIVSILVLLTCMSISNSSKELTGTNILNNILETSISKMDRVSDYLEAIDYDYSRILTREDVFKYYDIDAKEVNSTCGEIKGKDGSCIYSWESTDGDVNLKQSGESGRSDDDRFVGIKGLSFYLGVGSPEQIASTFDMAFKEYNRNSPKVMEASMKDEKPQFELIEDIGSRAYWSWSRKGGGELVVLAGEANFTIVTKISNDANENLKLAMQLAEEVIEKSY